VNAKLRLVLHMLVMAMLFAALCLGEDAITYGSKDHASMAIFLGAIAVATVSSMAAIGKK